MQTFIDTLVNTLPDTNDLRDYTFIFPNRRAGLFFTRAISQKTKNHGTILLPKVSDINHFVESKSPLTKADDTQLLIYLYKAYITVTPSDTEHKLSAFIELGSKILHDFNEIDKYLVNAQQLFQNITDLNSLTANLDTEVSQFYRTLLTTQNDSPLLFHQRFSTLWNSMYPLYTEFKKLLKANGIAYEGMIYREMCDADDTLFNERHITFAGFNILTETEKRIIERYPNRQMVFDYNTVERKDTSFDYKAIKTSDFHFNIPQTINAYPCMTSANQTLVLNNILNTLISKSSADEIERNTAIILADESLLTETLSNIPSEIKNLNITMGYPLANTQIAILTNTLIRLQLNIKKGSNNADAIYHKPLTDLLTHPYIHLLTNGDATKFAKKMTRENRITVPLTDLATLGNSDLFARNNDPFDYLDKILTQLENAFSQFDDPATTTIDLQFISQYRTQLANLKLYLNQSQITADEQETYALIRRLTRNMKAQFLGEPLKGLQIMGLLECRLLDFDNIIFVGFNDNFVPGTSSLNNTITPYSLRKPYGLPSFEITNSIYAYNFYRMLHRCSTLHLIYNTATNEKSKSEPSRFYNQLRYIYNRKINTPALESNTCVIDDKTNLFTPFMGDTSKPLTLERLSASAFKHFVVCPLRFYYEYVLKLKQPDEIEETITESMFGLMLHRAMELYYNTIRNNYSPLANDAKKSLISRVCEESFAEIMQHSAHNRGYDILTYNSLHTIVTHIINFDDNNKQFTNIATETTIQTSDLLFNYKAVIDRIDRTTDGTLNIIDYKTSTDKETANLSRMFDSANVRKTEQEVMQVLMYCYILRQDPEYSDKKITPYLFKAYSLAKDEQQGLSPLEMKIDGKTVEITSYDTVKEPFEAQLTEKLNELKHALESPTLFNITARNTDNCKYCPFSDLCMTNKKYKDNS